MTHVEAASPSVLSLDKLAAERAQQIIAGAKEVAARPEQVDGLVTKALGVLQDGGVYACGLYLTARSGKGKQAEGKVAAETIVSVCGLLRGLGWPVSEKTFLEDLAEKVIGGSLDGVLLARGVLEKMLVYCRYGAKAWDAETGENNGQ